MESEDGCKSSTLNNDMSERFQQTGHVHVPVEFDGIPRSYVFALTPNFSMHSFSAAVEPLRIANQLTGRSLFHWETRSLDGQPVIASNGLALSSDGKFKDLPKGANLIACSGDDAEKQTPKELTDWLRLSWRKGHIVGGLCTGAYALCKAGILNGHNFTLHWECQPAFEETYPDLKVKSATFVVDRRIVTSGGGVGSTDLMLHLIGEEFGRQLRCTVADMCLQVHVRNSQDAQRSLTSKIFGTGHPKLMQAMEYLQTNMQDELDINEWAAHLGISRRQLERIFIHHTGFPPKKFATNLRLEHAYSLVIGTSMSVVEIAEAVGLPPSTFRLAFRKRFGMAPAKLTRQLP